MKNPLNKNPKKMIRKANTFNLESSPTCPIKREGKIFNFQDYEDDKKNCKLDFQVVSELRENSNLPQNPSHFYQISVGQNVGKSKNIFEKHRIMGTPEYIAPEILNDGEMTEAIDWWQLGILAYELLVGTNPFTDVTVQNIFNRILSLKIEWP